MKRIARSAVTLAASSGLVLGGVAVAGTANADAPRLNGPDARFLRANQQTNLAELTIGRIAMHRSHNPAALALSRRTTTDHRRVYRLNAALAKRIGVRDPAAPNAMQQRVAAQLKKVAYFNRDYFMAEIAGHKMSISATRYEIGHGNRPRVVAFAKHYLPVAQMHLAMAQRDLANWNRNHPNA